MMLFNSKRIATIMSVVTIITSMSIPTAVYADITEDEIVGIEAADEVWVDEDITDDEVIENIDNYEVNTDDVVSDEVDNLKIDELDAYTESLELLPPTNLGWKSESLATATWDAVAGANYYSVTVWVYENDELIGSRETGTDGTEIELQSQIHSIVGDRFVYTVNVVFGVIAKKNPDGIVSEASEKSHPLEYVINSLSTLRKPTGVVYDDNTGMLRWNKVDGAESYAVTLWISREDLGSGFGGEIDPETYEGEYIDHGTYIEWNVKDAYKSEYAKSDDVGYEVKITFKVAAVNSEEDKGEVSDETRPIYYSCAPSIEQVTNAEVIKKEDGNYYARWDKVSDAVAYDIRVKFFWDYKFEDIYCYEIEDNKCEADITEILKQTCFDVLNEECEYVSVQVRARDSEGLAGKFSENSERVNYDINYDLSMPTQVKLDVDKDNHKKVTASWKHVDGAKAYIVTFTSYSDSGSGSCAEIYYEDAYTLEDNICSVDVTDVIYEGYTNSEGEYYGKGMPEDITVRAFYEVGEEDSIKRYSKWSERSNRIYYYPYEADDVDSISLSPRNPIVAEGNSIYLGLTISPETAFYDKVYWYSDDWEIAVIDENGKVTGINAGEATITAQVCNAADYVPVNVYKINDDIDKGYVDNKEEILDRAGDVLDNINNENSIEGTDVTDIDVALNEIKTCIESDEDDFYVEFDEEKLDDEKIAEIKNEITLENGENVIGAYDCSVEVGRKDREDKKHPITHITEFYDDIIMKIMINANVDINKLKVYRMHDGKYEKVEIVSCKDGVLKIKTKKFSEFALVTSDTSSPAPATSDNNEEDKSYDNVAGFTRTDISGAKVTVKNQTYAGKELAPTVTVKLTQNGKTTTLTAGSDYLCSYSNNVNAGTATVTIIGSGLYKGTVTKEFKINAKSIKKFKVSSSSVKKGDSASAVTDGITVYDGSKALVAGTDYTLDTSKVDTSKAGKTTVTVNGIGNYKDKCSVSVQVISVADASKLIRSAAFKNAVDGVKEYKGKAYSFKADQFTVKADDGSDIPTSGYTITAKNVTNVGTGYVTIKGKGKYKGSVVVPVEIKAPAVALTVSQPADTTFNGKIKHPKLTVKARVNGKTVTLKANKDYVVSYSNNVHAGKATLQVIGIGNYANATAEAREFNIKQLGLKKAKITGNKTNGIKVTMNKRQLVEGVDYTAEWKDNTKGDKSTVTITGLKDYNGTCSKALKVK